MSFFAPGLSNLIKQKKNLIAKLNAQTSKNARYKKRIEKLKALVGEIKLKLEEKEAEILQLREKLKEMRNESQY